MKQPAVVIVGIAFLLLLCACSSSKKIYVVRHAEKAGAMSADPPLTTAGEARAMRLAALLKNRHIQHIYSTNTIRTVSTASPLAASLKLPVERYGLDSMPSWLNRIQTNKGNSLIVGHSNTVLKIVAGLGVQPSIREIGDADYDNLFEVRINKKRGRAPRLKEKKY